MSANATNTAAGAEEAYAPVPAKDPVKRSATIILKENTGGSTDQNTAEEDSNDAVRQPIVKRKKPEASPSSASTTTSSPFFQEPVHVGFQVSSHCRIGPIFDKNLILALPPYESRTYPEQYAHIVQDLIRFALRPEEVFRAVKVAPSGEQTMTITFFDTVNKKLECKSIAVVDSVNSAQTWLSDLLESVGCCKNLFLPDFLAEKFVCKDCFLLNQKRAQEKVEERMRIEEGKRRIIENENQKKEEEVKAATQQLEDAKKEWSRKEEERKALEEETERNQKVQLATMKEREDELTKRDAELKRVEEGLLKFGRQLQDEKRKRDEEERKKKEAERELEEEEAHKRRMEEHRKIQDEIDEREEEEEMKKEKKRMEAKWRREEKKMVEQLRRKMMDEMRVKNEHREMLRKQLGATPEQIASVKSKWDAQQLRRKENSPPELLAQLMGGWSHEKGSEQKNAKESYWNLNSVFQILCKIPECRGDLRPDIGNAITSKFPGMSIEHFVRAKAFVDGEKLMWQLGDEKPMDSAILKNITTHSCSSVHTDITTSGTMLELWHSLMVHCENCLPASLDSWTRALTKVHTFISTEEQKLRIALKKNMERNE